jgi:hypothetical protein
MRLYTFLLLMICSLTSFAQKGWRWGKGANYTSTYVLDPYTSVTDKSGNTYMSVLLEGSSVSLGSIALSGSGGVIQDMIFAKIDSNGQYQWASVIKRCGIVNSMALDNAGNVYAAGTYSAPSISVGSYTLTNSSPGSDVAFLVKFSNSGSVLNAFNISSGGFVRADVDADALGNIYLSGQFFEPTISVGGTVLYNANTAGGTGDIFVYKMNSSGTVWGKRFGSQANDDYQSSTATPNGQFYLYGRNYFDSVFSIGGTVTIDSFWYLVRFDAAGNAVSHRQYDQYTHPVPRDMTTDAAGNVFACGSTMGIFGGLGIVRYDSTCGIAWERVPGGSGTTGWSIAVDSCGKVFVAGSMATSNLGYSYSIMFPGYTLHSPAGSYDPMFVAEYDAAGNYIFSTALPSGGEDWSTIGVDRHGNFYLIGDFYPQTPMTFGPDVMYLMPSVGEGLFVSKFRYDSSGCDQYYFDPRLDVNDVTATDYLSVEPNPGTTEVTITSGYRMNDISLYDLTGRLLISMQRCGRKEVLNVEALPAGVYIIKVNEEANIRFLKQ